MKCSDCGANKAYTRKGLVWRLCKPCWINILAILGWAQGPSADPQTKGESDAHKDS